MSVPALVAADGSTPLAAAVGRTPSRAVPLDKPYRAASYSAQELAGWRPPTVSADGAVLPAKDLALARARDLVRDDPHARAGLERRVDLLVGAGVRLVAAFDAESLGLDRETDRDIIRATRRAIEREWRLFALDPMRRADATRQMSLNGRFRQLARTWVTAGEATYVLRWRSSGGGRYRTCVQAIDPDRLANPAGRPDTESLRGGIEFDALGAAVAYHVRNGHPGDFWLASTAPLTFERVPRETSWGRPVFVHGFEPEREGQSRAITPFATIVQRLKMIGRHADLEIANATANALIMATLESQEPEVAARSIASVDERVKLEGQRADFYDARPPVLGGVRIPVLRMGDKLTVNSSPRQTTAFPAFQTAFLRSVASALGVSYEQLSMDWSQTNYSSARAALNEIWRGVRRDFAAFVEQVVMPIYMAFLEESFDRGYVKAPAGCPGFWDMPEAWCASRWIGSPRGYVDPVKEAQGQAYRLDNLTSTLEAECAEQGSDMEEVLDQRQYEAEELARRKLARIGHNGGPPLNANDGGSEPPNSTSP